MLVQLFKNNNPSSFIFLSLLALLLWVNGFVLHPSNELPNQVFLFGLFNNFHFHPSFLTTSIALLLVLGEAFLLNYMVNKYEILSKSSFLPALFYIILMSMDNGMLLFYPSIISNFLILLIIFVLLESYRKDIAFSNAFDAGALCSMATLFYPPTIILFPVLGIGLFVLRPFNWREWVICFIGICAPYLFVFCYYFWTDQMNNFWNYPFIRTTSFVTYSSSLLTAFSMVILILLLSIGKLINNLRGGSQKKSKGTLLLIWLAFLSLLSLYWTPPSVSCGYLSLFFIPVSVFCAEYIASVKKVWWGEFLFAVLFISIIVNLMSVYF